MNVPETDPTIAKSALDRYYAAFNTGSKGDVLAAFTADAEFVDLTMGRRMHGPGELARFIDDTWRLSPFFRLEPEQIVHDGAGVAVQLQMSGARLKRGSSEPDPKTLWRIPSVSFFRFRGDQICWKADLWNAMAIPEQIGWLRTASLMIRNRFLSP